MPTPPKGPRMGGSPAHERHMLANLATSLFEHGRITTTEAKAKRLRPYAEHLITFGKRGDLHARRQVLKRLRDKSVVHTLFAEIGPRYANRPGGYTRILKLGNRKGDNAPMAIIEVVEALTVQQSAVGEAERARGTRTAPTKAPTGATRESAEALAAESPTAAAVAAQPETDVVPVDDATGTVAEQTDNAAGDVTQDLTGGALTEPAAEQTPDPEVVAEIQEANADLTEAQQELAAAEAELAAAQEQLVEVESPDAPDSEDTK